MSGQAFCPITGNMLTEATEGGQLVFKSPEGMIYPSKPEDSVLHMDTFGGTSEISKHQNTLEATAFDPVNPRIANPCPNCKSAIVSYQRVGASNTMAYACICGYSWHDE